MNDSIIKKVPTSYSELLRKSVEIGFTMPSDLLIGNFLKTLVSSKPGGNFLELGTGIGLSTSWIMDGMDSESKFITIDNDAKLIEIVKSHFGQDSRIEIIRTDGVKWIKQYDGDPFDLIFADAWPGKYSELDETLGLLKTGGFYVIDDMMTQPNWPTGHQEKADRLIDYLQNRDDLNVTILNWSTGIVIAAKKD